MLAKLFITRSLHSLEAPGFVDRRRQSFGASRDYGAAGIERREKELEVKSLKKRAERVN
jgi:hypothetical protein